MSLLHNSIDGYHRTHLLGRFIRDSLEHLNAVENSSMLERAPMTLRMCMCVCVCVCGVYGV